DFHVTGVQTCALPICLYRLNTRGRGRDRSRPRRRNRINRTQLMAIEIKAPQFPESVADGTVATWHKQPGEAVKRDELIVDIETRSEERRVGKSVEQGA